MASSRWSFKSGERMRINRTGWLFVGEGALMAESIIFLSHSSGGNSGLYFLMLLLPLISLSRGVISNVLNPL